MNKELIVAALFLASFQASAGSFSDKEFRARLSNAQASVNADVKQLEGLCDKKGKHCDLERGEKLNESMEWHVGRSEYIVSINGYANLKGYLDRIPTRLDKLDIKVKKGSIKSYADSSFDLFDAFRDPYSIDPSENSLWHSQRDYYSKKTQDALRDLNSYALQMKGYDKHVVNFTGWPNE